MKKKFDVYGMTCGACSAHVEKSVSKVEGVNNVSVNLLQNSMQVDYDESITGVEEIVKELKAADTGLQRPECRRLLQQMTEKKLPKKKLKI